MNSIRINQFTIRPSKARLCSVGSTGFTLFFCFPRIAEIVVFKSRAYNFINNACLVQNIPLPFMSLLRSCFLRCLPGPCCASILVECCIVFLYKCVFLCGDFSQGECFFFSSCRRFPQTLFHIHKHVYEGLAPVLTSFELLHGTLPFLFKAPFFITLFLFPLIHDELPRGA